MNNIYTTSISLKRKTGDFIIKKEQLSTKDIKEMVMVIREIFKMRGLERVTRELKGFIHNFPSGSYIKFTLKVDHDFSVISSGGGLLGYISDSVYDAYDTFVFSNVDSYLPGKPLKSIDELRFKWTNIQQIVPLLEYQADPSILSKSRDYSTHIDYSCNNHVHPIKVNFSPKQISTQHSLHQQIEKDNLKLSSSPKLKSKEGIVGSPTARAF
ncbi:hypothetical protein DDB_G0282021 [Dictyostelium discoideum AX4]|uniref:Uncharacterized protein DDB_G0282021 n=1 Tax=Dictyostelium discoideum TaxID=44689 RepID=Y0509_DICDI|nr:hypothetical protein DDB_G0282021 [Dictyostelium discoideum AX4]Q54T40.1 RecName: Full=Uncharacterized protein DDB_G0282021 [Dictyostelium discoideum]EAL66432.1 hypothetical protein DDB_G0282021 [Dictyostelium discoideum AX4]|eukprot:XP_640411.1 hypothetical protein DDB_G0282021 [Dictyostelium discoideum AX4]